MRLKPLIAVPLIAIALAGCTTQQPEPQASVTRAEEQPLFATDDEALAAAQVAYAHYLEVSDQIARDGGANPERLKGLVSAELYSEQVTAYSDLQSSGLFAGGSTAMDHFRIQDIGTLELGKNMAAYVCLDVSNNPVLDSLGNNVTPEARESRIPLLIGFASNNNRGLIIETSEVWSGTNFC
jgi:hypothetical protein